MANELTQSGSLGGDQYGRLLEPWIADLAIAVVAAVLLERAFRRDSTAFILPAAIGLILAMTDFNFSYLAQSTYVGLLIEGEILLAVGYLGSRVRRRLADPARRTIPAFCPSAEPPAPVRDASDSGPMTTCRRPDRSAHRLVQFSDGVFTVALTLLVIDIAVPVAAKRCVRAAAHRCDRRPAPEHRGVPARRSGSSASTGSPTTGTSSYIRRYDCPLLVLNLSLLMTICFIPWPTAVLGHYGNYFSVWVLYAVAMAAMGLASAAVWCLCIGQAGPGRRRDARAAALFPAAVHRPAGRLPRLDPDRGDLAVPGQLSWIAILVILWLLVQRFQDRIESHDRAIV